MEHYLIVSEDGNATEIKAESKIGRSRTNEVVLSDPLASRHHATLYFEGETLMIRDEQSVNGTIVNGGQIYEPTALKDQDTIQFGDELFRVRAPLAESKTVRAPKAGGETVKPVEDIKADGTRKAMADKPVSPPQVDSPGGAPMSPLTPKKNNKTLWIVLGVLVLLCICCAATVLIARQFDIPGIQNIIGFVLPMMAG